METFLWGQYVTENTGKELNEREKEERKTFILTFGDKHWYYSHGISTKPNYI